MIRDYYIHNLPWDFRVAQFDYNGQMRRPQSVERATLEVPRLIFLPLHIIILLTTESGTIGPFNISLTMDKKMNNEELQSRRQFFKGAAKAALPILAAVALAGAPTIAKAADVNMGCETCLGTCSGSCKTSCSGTCSCGCSGCRNTCSGTCSCGCSGCRNTCSGSCSCTSR